MTLFVDTSVWSLAFRRDGPSASPEVNMLRSALEGGDIIVTTGIVLQELLQGFAGPRAGKEIIGRFSALPFLMPDRQDHIDAAELRACEKFKIHRRGAEAQRQRRGNPSVSVELLCDSSASPRLCGRFSSILSQTLRRCIADTQGLELH